jgi:hypothetical protein
MRARTPPLKTSGWSPRDEVWIGWLRSDLSLPRDASGAACNLRKLCARRQRLAPKWLTIVRYEHLFLRC